MTNAFSKFGIEHLSPSSINQFASAQALFVMSRVLKAKVGGVGPAAHRGTAVESAVAAGLKDPTASLASCVAVAMDQFNLLTALSPDTDKVAKEAASITGFVEQGLMALRPYGVPTSLQAPVSLTVPGLAVPIIGFADFVFPGGILVDLKTTAAIPSKISSAHARQVALYAAVVGGDAQPRLAYVSSKKSSVLGLENVEAHVKAITAVAMSIQRFLSLSDDAKVLAGLCAPDVDSFYYSDPITRASTFEVYGV